MSDINIKIPAGKKKRLLTGGKYCPDDIVAEAEVDNVEAEKTVTPSKETIYVEPADGYSSIGRVVVLGVPFEEIENDFGGKTVKIGT